MSSLKTLTSACFSILLIVVTFSVAVVCPFLFARRPAGPAGGRAGGLPGRTSDALTYPALRLVPRDDDTTTEHSYPLGPAA